MLQGNPEVALRELAKAYRRKVSACRAFDANVCFWRVERERPWELIPVTGSPFLLKTGFNHQNRKVHAMANSEWIGLFFERNTEIVPLSINKPATNFYGPYHHTGRVKAGEKTYPVFTKDESLSEAQQAFVDSGQLRDLIEHIDLQTDERILINGGSLSIYLHFRPADFLQRALDLVAALSDDLETKEQSPALEELPDELRILATLVCKWATGDAVAREVLIESASRSELADLISSVSPHVAAINAHLDSFGDRPLDSSAIKLGQLAEAADEAKRFLEE